MHFLFSYHSQRLVNVNRPSHFVAWLLSVTSMLKVLITINSQLKIAPGPGPWHWPHPPASELVRLWSLTFLLLEAQLVKSPPAMRKTLVRSLHWEDPLGKRKATHSSILAWRVPWTVVHRITKSRTQVSDFHLNFPASSPGQSGFDL